MIYDLQLKKEGRLFTKVWDSNISTFTEDEIDIDEVPFHTNDFVCLEESVTLRDVFLLISKDINFFSALCGCPFLKSFVEEALLSPLAPKNDIGTIRLKWIAYLDMIDNEKYLTTHIELYGAGVDKKHVLELAPLYEINHFPIILDTNFKIVDLETEEEVFKSKKSFTLSNLIRGIVKEISQFGPPEGREIFFEALSARIDELGSPIENEELDQDYDSKNGVSFDSIKQKLKDSIKIRNCSICNKETKGHIFGKSHLMCAECFMKEKEN